MKCEYCDNKIQSGMRNCPACGASVNQMREVPYNVQINYGYQTISSGRDIMQINRKSRIGFILFAVFLGPLGVHNFYAGYVGKGVTQLLITIFTLGFGSIITGIWAIIEACVVTRDAQGNLFHD